MADERLTDHPANPILIVDDDAALLEALAKTLQRAGHSVKTAQTAEPMGNQPGASSLLP